MPIGFPYHDHPPEDDEPPTFLCGVHRWADDTVPCEHCTDELTQRWKQEPQPMSIIAKATPDRVFTPAPEGQHVAVCCDVIDMGDVLVEFRGEKKLQHKVRIVWELPEAPKVNDHVQVVSARFTLSLHERSSLRKFLVAWRGRQFTPAELAGFDVERLLGAPALVNVVHAPNPKDPASPYANIATIMALPSAYTRPQVSADYIRAKDRKPAQGAAPGAGQPAQAAQQYTPTGQPVLASDTQQAELYDDDIPF